MMGIITLKDGVEWVCVHMWIICVCVCMGRMAQKARIGLPKYALMGVIIRHGSKNTLLSHEKIQVTPPGCVSSSIIIQRHDRGIGPSCSK